VYHISKHSNALKHEIPCILCEEKILQMKLKYESRWHI
jgi:hypothetical protein